MARLDDSTLAALLLTSRLVPDGPPPLKAREFWALVESVGGDPAVLLGDDPPPVAPEPDERIRGLLDRATAFAFALEDAERAGINVVSAFDVRYPGRLRERLGHQAPPALHVAGPLALLVEPGLAIVGAGDDPDAVEVARSCAASAAGAGLIVITGGADGGTDAAATTAALDAGGRVVAVLADPLTRRIRRPEVRRAIHEGRLCLATPYHPDAPYSQAADAGRIKLLVALADLTLVIDGDEDAVAQAVRHDRARVAVWREADGGAEDPRSGDRRATPVHDLGALIDLATTPPPPTP